MKLYFTKVILGAFLLFATFVSAQNLSKNQFKVKGNCEMCKERIETTAKKAGAKSAQYSIDSQTLIIETSEKVSPEDVLKKVAEAGHDNEKFKAPDETYEKLPGCCHYDRDLKTENSNVENHNHSKGENEFFVKGNCESCKARIEKAAKSAGANSAEWSAEKQTVTLNFDSSKTSADQILKKIAEVGHDNEKYKTTDDVYKKLPGCCLYDRDIEFGEKNEKVHSNETEKEFAEKQANTEISNHSSHATGEKKT